MLKVAVLDLYQGTENQGIPSILAILKDSGYVHAVQRFDVRSKGEIPDMSFDLYISSGGPGNPLEGDGVWDVAYYRFIDLIFEHNKSRANKKFHLLICHSFQMICHHLKVAKVCKRKSRSFGTFPCHKTSEGELDPLLEGLDDPFWVADFRNFQVVQANKKVIESNQFKILCLEKKRPHVALERAIMGIRFSDEVVGFQFHPEANPQGMIYHFEDELKRTEVIDVHGREKYVQMLADLKDPDKISNTYQTLIPKFIEKCFEMQKNKPLIDIC